MVFARKVWAVLVGVKDAMALVFLLLFFLALYAVLTARPGPGQVIEGAMLFGLDGVVVEEPAIPDPITQLVSRQAPVAEYRARDIVRALRGAVGDDAVKVVVFDLSRFMGGGLVHMQEIGAAMDEVREAGKPVLTYATAYVDDGILLAAHSSEAWVDPLGGALVSGPGGERLYYAGLLEKLKVDANVYRVGTFKSAVEPYMRSDASPEAKEAYRSLYAAMWDAWKGDVERVRPKAQVERAALDPVAWLEEAGGDGARAAVAAGLADKTGTWVQFGERVAELAGEDEFDETPGSFAHTPFGTWLSVNAPETPGKAIGVVTVAGEIVDGDAGPGIAGGERIGRLLDDALDRDFAALVVRVDSPGGSIMASERIRDAILRYKARDIPVVVSMANVAASGGYWVSTPASRIFAEPGTITGSIGVFAVVPTFERALQDIGVNSDGVRTTPLSGQPDLLGGFTPEVGPMIQAYIEDSYRRFLTLVAKSRGMTAERTDTVAQGRPWDGGTARQLGLVDEFGGLDEALAHAAKVAGLDDGDWHPVFLGGGEPTWLAIFESLDNRRTARRPTGRDFAALAADRQMSVLDRIARDVDRLLTTRGAQAYCLECPPEPAATARRERTGLVDLLLARFAGS